MSAFLCNEKHIAFLASASAEAEGGNPCEIAKVFAIANLASIDHRYPGDDAVTEEQAYIDDSMSAVKPWPDYVSKLGEDLVYAQLTQSARCYEYQSCEHPLFYESTAYKKLLHVYKYAAAMLINSRSDDLNWGAPSNE